VLINHPIKFHLREIRQSGTGRLLLDIWSGKPSDLLQASNFIQQRSVMSDAYERERQNNSRLSELSAKVTALRGVTVDIYDNARAQDVIDNTSDTFTSMGSSLKGSAGRLGRMAATGNKIAILKLAGIIIGVVLLLWFIWGLFA